LVFILFTGIILGWLALQYNDHDEHWFVFALDLGCGGGLLFITYFLLSFSTNALATVRSTDLRLSFLGPHLVTMELTIMS